MSAPDPADFPRRILFITLGLAPQVLTETLYVLGARRSPPFIPTEIHVATTREGAHRARLTLLDPASARLRALETEHALHGLAAALPERNIHVIASPAGSALDDIDSAEDNAAAADLIAGLVRGFTADPEAALHVSIAGGRKTMGFLAGYALSLFGRPQDRLSHVLVSPPFQDHQEFFFPPSSPLVLRDRTNRPVSTADARLVLADIPVVRLRDHLPSYLLSGDEPWSDLVARAQLRFAPPSLLIDHANRTIVCQGMPIRLPPQAFALAAWLGRRATSPDPALRSIRWDDEDWSEYLDEYALVPEVTLAVLGSVRDRLTRGDELKRLDVLKAFHSEQSSLLRGALKRALGPLAPAYVPKLAGGYGRGRLGFNLPPEAIRFTQ